MVRRLLTACRWDKEKLLERYYAGDQDTLFKEAHVVNPAKKPKPKVPVVKTSLTTKVSMRVDMIISMFIMNLSSQLFPVQLLPPLYKNLSVIFACWPIS